MATSIKCVFLGCRVNCFKCSQRFFNVSERRSKRLLQYTKMRITGYYRTAIDAYERYAGSSNHVPLSITIISFVCDSLWMRRERIPLAPIHVLLLWCYTYFRLKLVTILYSFTLDHWTIFNAVGQRLKNIGAKAFNKIDWLDFGLRNFILLRITILLC